MNGMTQIAAAGLLSLSIAAHAENQPIDLSSYGYDGITNAEILDHVGLQQPSEFHINTIRGLIQFLAEEKIEEGGFNPCKGLKGRTQNTISSPYLTKDVGFSCFGDEQDMYSQPAVFGNGNTIDLSGGKSLEQLTSLYHNISIPDFTNDDTTGAYNQTIVTPYIERMGGMGLYPLASNASLVLSLENAPFYVDVKTPPISIGELTDTIGNLKLPNVTKGGVEILGDSLDDFEESETFIDPNFGEINITYVPLDQKSDVSEAFRESMAAEALRRIDAYNQNGKYSHATFELTLSENLSGVALTNAYGIGVSKNSINLDNHLLSGTSGGGSGFSNSSYNEKGYVSDHKKYSLKITLFRQGE